MSGPKHTPGPWVVRGEVGKTLCVTDGDSRYVVPRLDCGSRGVEEQAANGVFIAAAPAFAVAWGMVPDEVKAAVFAVLRNSDTGWVEQAIAKATGGHAP